MDTSARPGRRRAAGLVAAGLVGGVVLAGFATAAAQTSPAPTPTQSQSQSQPQTQADPGPRGKGGRHGGHGMGMGIHGEFVAPAPNGGYQTIATQRGEVTAVSATSLTVRSEDGFSRTYTVDDNTLVNAGNNGIADVKTGDQVHVTALVVDGKASAVDVRDVTQVGRLRDRYAPRKDGRGGKAPGTAPGKAPGTAPGTAPGGSTTPSGPA